MKILIMTDEGELLEMREVKNPTGDIHNRLIRSFEAGEEARKATLNACLTLHLRAIKKKEPLLKEAP